MTDEVAPLLQIDELPKERACWNCGFFCLKDEHNRHISAYYELTRHNREWGRFFGFVNPTAPWCYRDEPIYWEIGETLGHQPRVVTQDSELVDRQNAAALAVAIKDRQCPKWFPYKAGRGPDAHLQEVETQQLEESRREHALKLAELDLRSQESLRVILETHKEIADMTRRVTQELKNVTERGNQEASRWQWAFFMMAMVAIILALAALAYPNGATWLDWLPGQSAPSQAGD